MDDITHKIRARFDHEAAKHTLREKYEAKMLFAHQGGMFRASAELIVLLSSFTDDTIVILDEFKNPTRVNRTNLLQEAKQRHKEMLNAWSVELDGMSTQR